MKTHLPISFIVAFVIYGFTHSTVIHAQTPCSDSEYNQLNFWLGEWDVFVEGQWAGTNTISKVLDGCVIQEKWRGTNNFSGQSLNTFDPNTGKWNQVWVDNLGQTVHFTGLYKNDKLAMQGKSISPKNGQSILYKITLYNNLQDADNLRQVWEASKDNGKSWQTIFNGKYVKKSSLKHKHSPNLAPVWG